MAVKTRAASSSRIFRAGFLTSTISGSPQPEPLLSHDGTASAIPKEARTLSMR